MNKNATYIRYKINGFKAKKQYINTNDPLTNNLFLYKRMTVNIMYTICTHNHGYTKATETNLYCLIKILFDEAIQI